MAKGHLNRVFVYGLPLVAALLCSAGLAACRSADVLGELITIHIVDGSNQAAVVGTTVAIQPTIVADSLDGSPLVGGVIRFTVVGGNGVISADSSLTDGGGVARLDSWALGTKAGPNQLRATVAGTTVSVTFHATGTAGPVAALEPATSQGILIAPGTAIHPVPAIHAIDQYGNSISGTPITFSVTNGSGTATGTIDTTNDNGIAGVGSWTAGTEVGANVLTARSASSVTLKFTAYALTQPPKLTAMSPTTQAGFLAFPVTVIPRVQITDADGEPLPGAPVTFTVRGNGSIIGGSAIADADGIASPSDWHLGTEATSQAVASADLGAMPLVFNATGVPAAFRIDLRFVSRMTADERDALVAAARRWMRIIAAHLTPVSVNLPAETCAPLQPAINESVQDVIIFAGVVPIDGQGAIVASAGPCAERDNSELPVIGSLELDAADLPHLERNDQLQLTVLHEMGHVLGFGTIWGALGLVRDTGTADPIFTGPAALAQWPPFAAALSYSGRAVPLENTGGVGTQDVHWRKTIFHTELMTGFLEAPGVQMPLSRMTIAALEDLGYQVNYSEADAFQGLLKTDVRSFTLAVPLGERLLHPLVTIRYR